MSIKSQLKELMEKNELRTQKRLGQCFLIDENAIQKIASFALANGEEQIIEVGPGLGPLTASLISQAGPSPERKVIAIEVDKGLVNILEKEFAGKVQVIHADATEFFFNDIGKGPFALVGNLPYSVTTPLLLSFLRQKAFLGRTTVMIQKEVADRLLSKPQQKTYGSLTVLFQLHAEIDRIIDVPPECFWPKPKVWSSVIHIDWNKSLPIAVENELFFEKVVRAAFSQRRKTLRNSLLSAFEKEQVRRVEEKCSISLARRAETLTLQEFGTLVDAFWALQV